VAFLKLLLLTCGQVFGQDLQLKMTVTCTRGCGIVAINLWAMCAGQINLLAQNMNQMLLIFARVYADFTPRGTLAQRPPKQ
jgi:hypothetical protein